MGAFFVGPNACQDRKEETSGQGPCAVKLIPLDTRLEATKMLPCYSPTKADFIRAKHQMLAFVYRPARDEIQTEDADLSRQLHSSVRTVNLETSLRMLAQGANSNFLHPVIFLT